uniref:Ankyrin repeat and SAM domain-containing protein 6 n=1 Tax=Culex pipiens TaxID=7175 RepID=A0A8D8G5J9_CULPI
MAHKHVATPIALKPSVQIFRFSPESMAAGDVSFEAYKQAKTSSRKRSFSPLLPAGRSPDLSPIQLNRTFRVSPRMNTPRLNDHSKSAERLGKIPSVMSAKERRRTMFVIRTPLAKRQLEHRITVNNILSDLDLGQYIGTFMEEEIDYEVFLTLTEQDLRSIGIECDEDIKKILAKIAEHKS